jgi:hypothetical protein
VDQAVQDGVGHGRVVDHPVPFVHRELASDERGAQPVPVVEDLQQVAVLLDIEGGINLQLGARRHGGHLLVMTAGDRAAGSRIIGDGRGRSPSSGVGFWQPWKLVPRTGRRRLCYEQTERMGVVTRYLRSVRQLITWPERIHGGIAPTPD